MCDPYQTNLIGRSGKWLFKNVQLIWYESMRACMRAWDHVFYKNSGSKQHFCYGYPINAGSHICGNITTFLGMLVSPPPLSVSVAITHGRVVAYHVAPTHKVTWSFDHVIFQDLVTNLNLNLYVSTIIVPIATKHGRMVTYLAIKWHDHLIMWFWKITWQIKTITFALLQCLWPPNIAGWWLSMRNSHPFKVTWPVVLEITWWTKTISPLTEKPITTKFGLVVT